MLIISSIGNNDVEIALSQEVIERHNLDFTAYGIPATFPLSVCIEVSTGSRFYYEREQEQIVGRIYLEVDVFEATQSFLQKTVYLKALIRFAQSARYWDDFASFILENVVQPLRMDTAAPFVLLEQIVQQLETFLADLTVCVNSIDEDDVREIHYFSNRDSDELTPIVELKMANNIIGYFDENSLQQLVSRAAVKAWIGHYVLPALYDEHRQLII